MNRKPKISGWFKYHTGEDIPYEFVPLRHPTWQLVIDIACIAVGVLFASVTAIAIVWGLLILFFVAL